ncbi:hypothetical protein NDU88_000666 [Pleurodeles waltl]|uniref:Uncharacterized protein n=1 Tax=Pleurodeles waltl TaxID=8319 RepID=A0AAV7KPI9_PLEWA|nr:hypothetical protein NDU88_000666 [Pleurodeles waltl]
MSKLCIAPLVLIGTNASPRLHNARPDTSLIIASPVDDPVDAGGPHTAASQNEQIASAVQRIFDSDRRNDPQQGLRYLVQQT